MKRSAGFVAIVLAILSLGADSITPKGVKKQIEVRPNGDWADSGIDAGSGGKLSIATSGSVQYPDSQSNGPDGLGRGWKDLLRILPINSAGRGALIGRIGNDDFSQPFIVGASRELSPGRAGRLYFSINQMSNESGDGSFHVTVEVLDPGRAVSNGGASRIDKLPVSSQVAGVTQALLAKIPRRISDNEGNAGDVVNFLIAGSEQALRRTFDAAGWVQVDRTKKDAVLHGLLATLSKEAYTELPMSELYLFGRAQDYGLAHAEPFAVVAKRHHLRLWKAPFELNGQTLWVGAGTHDIGFDRDQRNNGVTHKIDPNVDDERKFIGDSLYSTGMVKEIGFVEPSDAVRDARTATGGGFRSDGRVLVMSLGTAGGKDRSVDFANVFCTVLDKEKPDAGDWGACTQYLGTKPAAVVALPDIPTEYRVLIVPGVLSLCASSAPAFQQGQDHLRQKHGLTVDLFSVPNASSESNGRMIAQYLKGQKKVDSRKFIVIGYSKGAPDVQEALARDPEAASAVAAFITVAGAVGGSPMADVMPLAAKRYIDVLHMGSCQGDLNAAFQSLRRDVRKTFLAGYPDPIVPTYSIAAVSDSGTTSKMMLENWKLLSVYGSREDSQLIRSDTLSPGAVDLGTARADHFAIALPFEFAQDASIQKLLDHNHYPRTTLLEALIRYVTGDLSAGKPVQKL